MRARVLGFGRIIASCARRDAFEGGTLVMAGNSSQRNNGFTVSKSR